MTCRTWQAHRFRLLTISLHTYIYIYINKYFWRSLLWHWMTRLPSHTNFLQLFEYIENKLHTHTIAKVFKAKQLITAAWHLKDDIHNSLRSRRGENEKLICWRSRVERFFFSCCSRENTFLFVSMRAGLTENPRDGILIKQHGVTTVVCTAEGS